MRHGKLTFKLGRTSSHRRCMVANMLKALIEHGRIETTVAKAKHLKRYADRMVTLGKKGDLASRRRAIAALMITQNALTPKEKRAVKGGDKTSYNGDRLVITELFDKIAPRYKERQGGYTRIIRLDTRIGDNAEKCLLEFV
ncbi:MAG: 50S ribosomal protein L17 [Simkaniaceae bacterium]